VRLLLLRTACRIYRQERERPFLGSRTNFCRLSFVALDANPPDKLHELGPPGHTAMVELCALIENALVSALQEDVFLCGPEGMLWLPLIRSFKSYWSSELAPIVNAGLQRGVFAMPSLIGEGEQRRFLLALPAGYHEAIEDTKGWLDHESAHTQSETYAVPSQGTRIL
jgi:hypothetical protein